MVTNTKATKEKIEENTKRVDPAKVKENDLMAVLTWVKVSKNTAPAKSSHYFHNNEPRTLEVMNLDNGNGFYVKGEELIANMFSADYFSETKQVTKTELATTLVSCYNVPLTVEFEKDNGELRKLRGRLIKADPLFGKSLLEDLDNAKGDRLRWLKHENLKTLIVQGTKYTLKGAK